MTAKRRVGRTVAGVMTLSLSAAAVSLSSGGDIAEARDAAAFDLSRQSASIESIVEFSRTHRDSPLLLELIEALPSALQPETCLRIADIISPDNFARCLAALTPSAGPTSPAGTTLAQARERPNY